MCKEAVLKFHRDLLNYELASFMDSGNKEPSPPILEDPPRVGEQVDEPEQTKDKAE